MGLSLSGVEGLAASGLTFSLLALLGCLGLGFYAFRLRKLLDEVVNEQFQMNRKLVLKTTFEEAQETSSKQLQAVKDSGSLEVEKLKEELQGQGREKDKIAADLEDLIEKLKSLEKVQRALIKKHLKLEGDHQEIKEQLKEQQEAALTQEKEAASEPKPVTHTTTPITIHKYVNPHPPPWETDSNKVPSTSGHSEIGLSSGRESVSSNGATSPDPSSSCDSHTLLKLPRKSIMFATEWLQAEASLPQDDTMISADIGFQSPDEYKPADIREPRPHSLWSSPGSATARGPTPGNKHIRPVPLLPLEKLERSRSSQLEGPGKQTSKTPEVDANNEKSSSKSPDSREDTLRSPNGEDKPPVAPESAGSGTLSNPGSARTPVDTPKGVYSYNSSFGKGGQRSKRSSPNISGSSSPGSTRSTRSRRSFGSSAAPLSARGINPEKHPELHAKEMKEMTRLIDKHCSDSAEVVGRTEIRCLWCKGNFKCPPYRPQSFYFKDTQNNGEHDGHFWTCDLNPNVSLQAGQCVEIGDGKVLI